MYYTSATKIHKIASHKHNAEESNLEVYSNRPFISEFWYQKSAKCKGQSIFSEYEWRTFLRPGREKDLLFKIHLKFFILNSLSLSLSIALWIPCIQRIPERTLKSGKSRADTKVERFFRCYDWGEISILSLVFQFWRKSVLVEEQQPAKQFSRVQKSSKNFLHFLAKKREKENHQP